MFDRGDLVLVPYPFTDMSASKRRPVLALTAVDAYGDFSGLPVTSRPRPTNGVPLTQSDMIEGTLPAPSWIRTDRVVTLNSGLVVKTVGRVSARLLQEALRGFCANIGCTSERV